MNNPKHLSELQSAAADIRERAWALILADLQADGFDVNVRDFMATLGMTVAGLTTNYLLLSMQVNPELAKKARDGLIEQLELSRKWL